MLQPRLPGAAVAPVWDPTEHEFQLVVIEAARTLGWRVAHFRLVNDKRRGWITPVAADGRGWPDLELVGRGRIIHRELKRRRGTVRPEQSRSRSDGRRMTMTTIIRVRCPQCRCDVLAEVRHVGRARRCRCPWCDRSLRVPTKGRT